MSAGASSSFDCICRRVHCYDGMIGCCIKLTVVALPNKRTVIATVRIVTALLDAELL